MSVEYLYEKKSDDDEYNEIWRALQREQSDFERILLSENKAFVMGRLFEAKHLTQKLRAEKYQQLNLVKEQLERQAKAEQVNAEEEEAAGRPNSLRRISEGSWATELPLPFAYRPALANVYGRPVASFLGGSFTLTLSIYLPNNRRSHGDCAAQYSA